MKIEKPAVCGSLESNDILIEVKPGTEGISVDLDSIVKVQFGEQIESVIRETLASLGVSDAEVRAVDRGALDCTIRARTETAALRAQGEKA